MTHNKHLFINEGSNLFSKIPELSWLMKEMWNTNH